MQISDFPIVSQLLRTMDTEAAARQDARNLARFGRPNNYGRVVDMLADLTAGLEAGEIMNPIYVSAKETVGRVILDNLLRRYKDDNKDAFYDRSLDHTVVELTHYAHPQSNTTAGLLKRLAKLDQKIPAVQLMTAYLQEITPITTAVVSLKDKVVKRQPKSEEEKRVAKFAPPKSSSKSVAIVQKLLTDIVDAEFQSMLKGFEYRNLSYLKSYRQGLKGAMAKLELRKPSHNGEVSEYYSSYPLEWHFSNKATNRKEFQTNPYANALLADVVEYGEWPDGKVRGEMIKPDAEAILKAKALQEAKEVRDYFIAKNLRKIVSILEAKGDENFKSAEPGARSVSLSGLEGTIHFEFKDDSAFSVTNSVVFVVNSFGTRFYRFPLRFHDVEMPGGVPMKGPSELKMNTIFLDRKEKAQ